MEDDVIVWGVVRKKEGNDDRSVSYQNSEKSEGRWW